MTELKSIKCRLFKIYDTAENISVDDLLRCSAEVRQQYDQIMTVWRRVHIVLDGITSASSQEAQEASLERCNALLATLPSWQNK
jgi:hypothetical protein